MRRILLVIGILLAAVFAAALYARSNTARQIGTSPSQPAHGTASRSPFDACLPDKPALSPRICSDGTIRSLNILMTQALGTVADILSPEGRVAMIHDHRTWLEAESVACDVIGSPSRDQISCISGAFRDKLRFIKSMIWQNGRYTIQRRQLVAARRLELGQSTVYVMDRVDYPRMDNGAAAGDAFNIAADKLAVRGDDQNQEFRTYVIAFAGPDLISMRFDSSTWPMGTNDPTFSTTALNVLMPEGRDLRADDVFIAGSAWRSKLKQLVATILCTRHQKCAPMTARYAEALTAPDNWIIEQDGLTVIADAICQKCVARVPWEALSVVLKPNAPSPMQARLHHAKPA
jgi:hypothetical protein